MHRLLAHIFDNSACLTRRQLKDYVSGAMAEEECYTVERHANDCSFCSEAIDGLAVHGRDSITYLDNLTPDFLHDHFHQSLPPVHLNSIASAHVGEAAKDKKTSIGLLHISALAATLLLSFFLIRGWNPAPPTPDPQTAMPVAATDTTAVAVTQKPAKKKDDKKPTALPPEERTSATVGSDIPDHAAVATGAPLDPKTTESESEAGKATNTPAADEATLPAGEAVPEANMAATAPAKEGIDHRQLADEAFDQTHYTRALRHYRQILSSSTATHEDKDIAGIRAARCYILLGSKAQAITLLREIADGDRPQSGEAGKLLAELN